MKAQFISVEGIDGCGKTTHMKFISDWLVERGVDLVCTREPGGTALGEKLREVLLTADEVAIADRSELLLFFAGRAQHLDEVILPALNAGRWVLCDRFIDSTYAYQGGGRGLDFADIEKLEKLTQGDLQSDLTLLLDAPVEVARDRMVGKDTNADRFEREKLEFNIKVQKIYRQRAKQFPQRIKLIDANQPIEKVSADILVRLEEFWQNANA